MNKNSPRGWYSRGYLPHFDGSEVNQFLTYRLADSLPQKVLAKLQIQVEQKIITDREMLINVEKYLDQGVGNCYLSNPKVAEIVEENLLRFADVKYKLHAWVIMPNHLTSGHFLVTPCIV